MFLCVFTNVPIFVRYGMVLIAWYALYSTVNLLQTRYGILGGADNSN